MVENALLSFVVILKWHAALPAQFLGVATIATGYLTLPCLGWTLCMRIHYIDLCNFAQKHSRGEDGASGYTSTFANASPIH